MIEEFAEYLNKIEHSDNRQIIIDFLDSIQSKFPYMQAKIAWGMPVFCNNQTYIIGVSAFKEHFSIAPEPIAIEKFADRITKSGYKITKGLFKIKWTDNIDYALVNDIIEYNLTDKIDCKTFWRK